MKNYIRTAIFLTSLLVISICTTAQNTHTNTQAWENVDQLIEKNLPESALKALDSIGRNADLNKDKQQKIRVKLFQYRIQLEKEPDTAPQIFQDFETFVSSFKPSPEKQLLYMMLAQLYNNYYHSSRHIINQRTTITGHVPDDMTVWSKQNFQDKIKNLADLSLQHADITQYTPIDSLSHLLITDTQKIQMAPTLFDFISYKTIELLSHFNESESIKNTYQNLIQFRKKEAKLPLLVYAELQLLKFENANNIKLQTGANYVEALDKLANDYQHDPALIEILAEKASHYLYLIDQPGHKRIAHQICETGIQRFPDYERIGLLKNIINGITTQSVYVVSSKVVKPNSNLTLNITTTNVTELMLDVYRINATALEYEQYRLNNNIGVNKSYPDKTLIANKIIEIPVNSDFEKVESEQLLVSDKFGIYEYVLYPKDKTNEENQIIGRFTVSDFTHLHGVKSPGKVEFYVLDRVSGKTQNQVELAVYQNKWTGNNYTLNLIEKVTTDSKGSCTTSFKGNYSHEVIFLSKGDDQYFSAAMNNYFHNPSIQKKQEKLLNIFTDRSVYRHGQTVYFKAICYQSNADREAVIPNTELILELIDANNGKILDSKSLKTNAFGSTSGLFMLPTDGLSGSYYIHSENQRSNYFLVESYKRPGFEVQLFKPKQEINFGTEVSINGQVKAFAGYAVPNAEIQYRILRKSPVFWRMFPVRAAEIVAHGAGMTDQDGNFSINFVPEKDKSIANSKSLQSYLYDIWVDVTDIKGETQQGNTQLLVSDQSLFIIAEIPQKIHKKEISTFEIKTETITGEKIQKDLKYTLIRLEDTEDYAENLKTDYQFKGQKICYSGTYNSKSKYLNLDLSKLKSGRYRLELSTTDNRNNDINTEYTFILYDTKDKRPPVKTYVWNSETNITAEPGENVKIKFGSSAPQVYVLYEVVHNNQRLTHQWIKMCRKIETFNIDFKNEFANGLEVKFTFVKDEKLFTTNFCITKKPEEKKLSPQLVVFRDKLKPGEQASWTIKVAEFQQLKKAGELLIGMYDASLDQIKPHTWTFQPGYRPPVVFSRNWTSTMHESHRARKDLSKDYIQIPEPFFADIQWFGLNISNNIYIRGMSKTGSIATTTSLQSAHQELVEVENDEVLFMSTSTPESQSKKPQIRSNFNETAFFYPQLNVDSLGNFNFSFTVPESLTRWKLKMLAHTQDLYFGQNEATIITQQDLMVQLNMPRFVRQSDKIILSANVVNLSDNTLTTKVRLHMIHPESHAIILLNDTNAISIELAPNENKALNWEVKGFDKHALLICKVMAESGNFSDGEQRYLPVLPDKALVTESYPFVVRSGQTKHVELANIQKLAKEVETRQLTLEFSSNPVWYAIQALPALSEPKSESAVDYFVAWYVNTLAANILAENPKIQQIFEQITQTTSSKENLQSALSKNQELKNILLEETPWVMDAKNESEQQQRIALLFDLNRQSQQRSLYFDKLSKLQLSNGAFSWFDGMGESRWITQFILDGLIKLKPAKKTQQEQTMIARAIQYLDLKLLSDYDEVKKRVKDYEQVMTITPLQLHYLTLKTQIMVEDPATSPNEAINYYLRQAELHRNKFGLRERAMTAFIMHYTEKNQIANEILKSLKEQAVKSEEMGMYWAKNKSGYFWHERPISVHTQILDAFARISGNNSDVDEMKIWLLKQKQTQLWDSPISSLDAIQALMQHGSDWISQKEQYTFKSGDSNIETATGVPGTGYVKTTLTTNDLKSGLTVSSLNHTRTSAPAWGAVYWQYYQDMDKVRQSGTALTVEKQLFVERIINNQKTLTALNEQNINSTAQFVKKGDKIISRMVVSTDRNLEFVALKDNRAANLEPVNQLSGCAWKENVIYYRTTKDASTQYFFSHLPKGTYVFEDEYFVNASGNFSGGTASIQCLYAPEFLGTSKGERVITY